MNHTKRLGMLWLLILVGLAVRLVVAWQPVPELVMRFNADDAYYYLTIARNVAFGRGVTFDGLAPTNGFHPLYLVLLVPIFWVTGGALELNVHLALTLLSLTNVLTALPLYAMVKRTIDERAAWVALVAWLFNPFVMAITLLGVESALYVWVMAWTLERYTAWQADKRRRVLFIVGILAGLAVLARTDGIFLVLALAFDLGWKVWQTQDRRGPALLGTSIGIVLLPWLVWNWITFGTWLQSSGAAILYTQFYTVPVTLSTLVSSVWLYSLTIVVMLFQGIPLVLMALGVWFVSSPNRAQPMSLVGNRLTRVLGTYAVLWFVFYALYFRHRQLWYFLPVLFIATWGIARVYASLQTRLAPSLRFGVTIFYVTSFAASLWFWSANALAFYPAQANGYRLARWINANTDPHARIGAWNAGILGYFSTRAIVNLDGVVNNEVYRYVSERHLTFAPYDLREYLRQKRIDYVTDYEAFCNQATWQKIEWLEPVFEFPSLHNPCTVQVYHVIYER